MSEAVPSGISENGGSPKASSPCPGKETAGGPVSASPSSPPSSSLPLPETSVLASEDTVAPPSGVRSSVVTAVEETAVPSIDTIEEDGEDDQDGDLVETDAHDVEAMDENDEDEAVGVEQNNDAGAEVKTEQDAPVDQAPSTTSSETAAVPHVTTAVASSESTTLAESSSLTTGGVEPSNGGNGGGSAPRSPQGAPAATPEAPELPCMRAELVVSAAGAHVINGLWGMNPAAHEQAGHTSPFELKLAAPRPGLPAHPPRASGHYSGFFMLQQANGKPTLKVDEKSVHLTFIANADGGHNVQGTGKNRFGQFTVTGSVDSAGSVQLFRAYVPKPTGPQTAGVPGRKRTNAAVAAGSPKRSAPLTIVASATLPVAATPAGASSPGSPGRGGGKSIQSLSMSSAASASAAPAPPVDSGVTPRSKRATVGDWKDKADIPVNREHAEPRVPKSAAAEPRVKPAAAELRVKAEPRVKPAAAIASSAAQPERKGKGKEHAQAVHASTEGSSPVGASAVFDEALFGATAARAAGQGVELPSSLVGAGESKAGRVRKLPAHLQEVPLGKQQAVRLNEHMRKCLGVLRDVQRHPSGAWFAVPVDWKGLNLPDYPTVVKKPMDLGTIKTLVETGVLSTSDEFRDHMLLVFRNATTYNIKKDSVVHVAAVELRSMFEDRFRQQVESLGTPKDHEEAKLPGVGRGRKAGGNGRPGAASSAPGRGRTGPRAGQPPPAQGAGNGGGGMVPEAQYMQLQQQMEMIQQQLHELRRQTSQEVSMAVQMQAQEVERSTMGGLLQFGAGPGAGGRGCGGGCGGAGGRGRGTDDSRPFTEAEKEALKVGISELQPEKLHYAVEIIKERSPSLGGDDDEEIEVDLDMLDAPTLHALKRYVKSCVQRKRKKSSSAAGQMGLMQHPSPGLPDELDMDVSALEEDALLFGDPKRGRVEDDDIGSLDEALPFDDV